VSAELPLTHLVRLSDEVGVHEHAAGQAPRLDIGYCTDDNGRLLAVACRAAPAEGAEQLARVALSFIERAHAGEGRFRLRLGGDLAWTSDPASDDACGRALWGLGVAAASAPWPDVRDGAAALFAAASPFRSSHPRAIAHAAIGAVAALAGGDGPPGALSLLRDAARLLPRARDDARWPWPEARLSYSNSLLPEAKLAVASVLGDEAALVEALALLEWLSIAQRAGERYSFVPVGGRGPGESGPGFDQQPIEAWAHAEACARAEEVTGDARWSVELERAWSWFDGNNDAGVVVYDEATGAGFDGVTARGVNANCGAESTLAAVATCLAARRRIVK
jgi:hypothetical protein